MLLFPFRVVLKKQKKENWPFLYNFPQKHVWPSKFEVSNTDEPAITKGVNYILYFIYAQL